MTRTRNVLLALAGVGIFTHLGVQGLLHDFKSRPQPPAHLQGPFDIREMPGREDSIQRLQKDGGEFDVLIIGGGASGSGCAVDAAARGLKTLMVERDDFASGTSSSSSKLLHGGVRYLEKAFWNADYKQFEMVIEALRERASVIKNAPHLSSQIPIVLPLHKYWQIPYYYVGAKAYDYLAGAEKLKPSSFLSKKYALELFPMLREADLTGAILYYDGMHDDARMNMTLAFTAALSGATVLNHVAVVRLLKDGPGTLNGAVLRDMLTGQEWPVRCRCVINATGPFADGIRLMDDPQAEKMIQGSSGVHITLPNYYCPSQYGLLDPHTSDGRVIFFLPWRGSTIAGTTDRPCQPSEDVTPTESEIAFLLKEIQEYLNPKMMVRRQDVLSAWAGIRPLVRDPNNLENTQALARNHVVLKSPSGLITLAGGKWTTYRSMAEDAVDEAVASCGLTPELPASCTKHLRLLGGHGYHPLFHVELVQRYGLATETAKHIAATYGDQAHTLLGLAEPTRMRWPKQGVQLDQWYPYTEAEVRYATRYEMARTPGDVLFRRTRLAALNVKAAKACLRRVVEIMGEELGWDETRQNKEYASTLAKLKRKFMTTLDQSADQSAISERLSATRSGGGI